MAVNRSRFRIGINVGISTAFVAMVLLTTFGVCAVVFVNLQRIMRDDLRKQLSSTVATGALLIDGSIHDTLRDPAQEGSPDYLSLKARLQAIKAATPDIRFVYTMRIAADGRAEFVVDAETDPENLSHIGDPYEDPTPELLLSLHSGETLTEADFTIDAWGSWLSGFAAIRDQGGKQAGILGIDLSADTITRNESQTLGLMALVASTVSLAVIILGFILARRITTPLRLLEQDMERIENFQIDGTLEIKSLFREITSIASTVEDVKDSLRSFRKYVPADLVAELIATHQQAGLGGERRDLTIFFSDIENFTTWSEYLDPEELIGVMARYFAGMTEIIHRHQGTVDKYIGDAIMAFWNAPTELDDHAFHACAAALECQHFQRQLNEELARDGLAEINTRIGLNSGEVIVGNVGYEQRLNYTALGDHVNLASRLEGLNKYYDTNIIVSANTACRVEGRFLFRCLDKVVVKGRARQIQIHELRGAVGAPGLMEDEALVCGLAKRPQDRPSQVVKERCEKLLREDPGPDWQGYIVLRDK
jgi:class 3 adenylate cyclase